MLRWMITLIASVFFSAVTMAEDYDNIGLWDEDEEGNYDVLTTMMVGESVEVWLGYGLNIQSATGLPDGLSLTNVPDDSGVLLPRGDYVKGTPTKSGKYTITFTDDSNQKTVLTVYVGASQTVNGVTWVYTVNDGQAVLGANANNDSEGYWICSDACIHSVSGSVTIPSSLGGYSVKVIPYGAFEGCSSVTGITVPNTVTTIDQGAFAGCSSLSSVVLGSSVNYIGCYAFSGTAISSITLPTSLGTLDADAFHQTASLTLIKFEGNAPSLCAECRLSSGSEPLDITCGNSSMKIKVNQGSKGWDGNSSSTALPSSGKWKGWPISFESESVAIVFNGNGGTASESKRTCTTGSTYGTLPSATRTGYAFNGWYTSSGTRVYSNSTVTGGITLYAHWTANSYTVTFEANGGTCGTTSKSVTYDSTYGTLPAPTRTEATFLGWFTARTGGAQVSSSTKVSITAAQTLYAHWNVAQYMITFDANGGNGGNAYTLEYGSVLKSLPTPSRTGYAFAGWYTSASGGSSVGASVTATGNVTYYAHWNINSYTVTFNANGGSCTETSRSREYGAEYGELPTPTRTGYTFTGWWTSTSGGTRVSSTTTTAADVTLYAFWEANQCVVTFDANGGIGGGMYSRRYDSTLGTLPFPSLVGYAFEGWYTAASGGLRVSESTTVSGDVTFYAHWCKEVYLICFEANGGSCSEYSRSREYEAEYGDLPTPNLPGYTFAGWWTSATGGTQAYSTTIAQGSVTLYAHWTPNSYNLAFDANGGSGSMAKMVMNYDSESALTACAFTRNGYRFSGWAIAAGGKVSYANGQNVKNLTSVNNGTVTIYAVWQPAVIKVNYFRQRYPWNGLVDVEIVITGDDWTEYPVMVKAMDGDGKSLSVSKIGLDTPKTNGNPVSLTNGTNHVVWDATTDLGVGYKSNSVRMQATFVK